MFFPFLPTAWSPVQLKDRNGISRYPATFVDWNAKDKFHPRSFTNATINPGAIIRIKVRGWEQYIARVYEEIRSLNLCYRSW